MDIRSALIKLISNCDLRNRFIRNLPNNILRDYHLTPDGKIIHSKGRSAHTKINIQIGGPSAAPVCRK